MNKIHSALIQGAVVIVVLLAAFAIRLSNYQYSIQDPVVSLDEQSYTQSAARVNSEGLTAFKSASIEYVQNPNPRFLPPPTRVAYVYALSALMRVTGETDKNTGVLLSTLFSMLSLILVAVIGYRISGWSTALFAVVLLGVSPIDLGLARRAWQDSMVGFASSGLMFLAIEYVRNTRNTKWLLIYIFAGALTLWIKESCFIFYGLVFGWMMIVSFAKERNLKFIIVSSLLFGLITIVSIQSLIILCGGYEVVYQILLTNSRLGDVPYIVQTQKGPWFWLVYGFWLLTPITSCMFCASAVTCARVFLKTAKAEFCAAKDETRAMTAFAVIVIVFIAITSVPEYFKNMRYMSAILAPAYLVIAYALTFILRNLKSKIKDHYLSATAAMCVLLVFSAAALEDYSTAQYLFFDKRIHDLSLGVLVDVFSKNPGWFIFQ